MAVRRSRRSPAPPEHIDRLLTWSRYHHVPEEFLDHADDDVRRLAELTEEGVGAFLRYAFAVGPDRDARSQQSAEVARRLESARRRFGDRAGRP